MRLSRSSMVACSSAVGSTDKIVTNAARMLRYAAWLKKQARMGRFHYLLFAAIRDKLRAAGWDAGRLDELASGCFDAAGDADRFGQCDSRR